jgi:predicted GNAT family N-acyltransferase
MNTAPPYTIRMVPWDSMEGRSALALRFSVFCDEQGFSRDVEPDHLDPVAHHAVAISETGEILATGRWVPHPQHPDMAKIGRMAVRRDLRGTGIGTAILRALLTDAESTPGITRAGLSSQAHAVPFYARLGFVAVGEGYLEEGAPHQWMEKGAG